MAIKVDPALEAQGIRKQALAREKRKLTVLPNLSASDISVYSNQEYSFLNDFLASYSTLSRPFSSSFEGTLPITNPCSRS